MFDWKPLDTIPNDDRLILLWLWPLDVVVGVKPTRDPDGGAVYMTRRGNPIRLEACRAWTDAKDHPDFSEAADF